jgi:aminopeptidase
MNKDILKKYAQLIVRIGVNVQKGQKCIVVAGTDQTELTEYVVEEAYQTGALSVRVEWQNSRVDRLHYCYGDVDEMGTVYPWQEAKQKQQSEELPCMIYIESDDPDALKGVNPQKLAEIRKRRFPVLKPYRDAMENKYQWVIVAAAGAEWAKKLFPDVDTETAVEKLWAAILSCVHMGDGSESAALACDPIKAWEEHNKHFMERCKWLNDMHFDRLRYRSANGTDFEVGLIPTAQWMGGGEYSLQNIYYNPNMPTEEIFTSPMKGRAEGVLVSTKPLSYQSQLIENFSIRFHEGKAVEVHAEKGEELLQEMIRMDETAGYLGEVALVPKESPINQSGILFYNTLFDENACCHVALGHGFTNVLQGFEQMTLEETIEAGVNDSMIHVDFMVGAEDLEITGITKDGREIPVFVRGTWAEN